MKHITKILLAAILLITLCSFGFNKPDKIQRRKGILSVDEKGKTHFEPLESFTDYTPHNDTVYQYKVQ